MNNINKPNGYGFKCLFSRLFVATKVTARELFGNAVTYFNIGLYIVAVILWLFLPLFVLVVFKVLGYPPETLIKTFVTGGAWFQNFLIEIKFFIISGLTICWGTFWLAVMHRYLIRDQTEHTTANSSEFQEITSKDNDKTVSDGFAVWFGDKGFLTVLSKDNKSNTTSSESVTASQVTRFEEQRMECLTSIFSNGVEIKKFNNGNVASVVFPNGLTQEQILILKYEAMLQGVLVDWRGFELDEWKEVEGSKM